MAKTFTVNVEIAGRLSSSLAASADAAEARLKRLSGAFKDQATAARTAAAEAAASFKGVAKLAAAGGVVFSVKHAFEGGQELAHELSNLKNAGRTAEEVAEGLRKANETILDMPTATLTNSVKILNETTGAFGDFKHAVENLRFNAKLGDVLKNSLGLDDPAHALGSLVKALEIRGAANDPARYKREAEGLGKAMVFYGGRLTADDIYTFASNAPSAVKGLDFDFMTKTAPALIQEMGGDKAGTGLTAFRKVIQGGISDQEQGKAWASLHMITGNMVKRDKKTGQIIGWNPGSMFDTDKAYANPLKFMEEDVIPRLQKYGLNGQKVDVNNPTQLQNAFKLLFKKEKSNAFANAIGTVLDRTRLHKDQDLMTKVLSTDENYDSSLLNDPRMASFAIKSAMTNIGSALTLPLMKPFAELMISVSRAINRLSASLVEHPEIAAIIAKIGAAILAWQAIRFAEMVTGIGAFARMIANLSLAAGTGLAARLVGISRAMVTFAASGRLVAGMRAFAGALYMVTLGAPAYLAGRLRSIAAGIAMLNAVGGRAAVLEAVGASLASMGASVLRFPIMALRGIALGMWALVANPVGIVLTAIVAGLTALGVWVYNNWGGITSFFEAFGSSFMKALGPGAAGAVSTVVGWLRSAWHWLARLLGPIDATGEKWKAWGEWAGKGVGTAVNALVGLPGVIIDFAQKAWNALVDFDWAAAGRAILSKIGSGLAGLGGYIGGKLGLGSADASPLPKLGTAIPLAGARALGGPVTKGLPYLVGERGPEIFVPSKSGTIETNGTLKALASSGGSARGGIAIGVNADQLDTAASKARAAGEAVQGLDQAVTPIVFTGSIDDASRRAEKLCSILDAIKASKIALGDLGPNLGAGIGDGATPTVDGGSGRGAGGSTGSGGGGSGGGDGGTPSAPMSALVRAGITDRAVESGLAAFNLQGAKKRGEGLRPIDPNAFSDNMASKAGGDLSQIVGGPGFNTRGVKNMNPGNIGWGKWAREHGATGAAGTDTGHGVAVFPNFAAGYKAMGDLAASKYRSGMRTLDQLIASRSGWTPGNHVAAANVARAMGLGPNDDAHLDDPAMLERFKRGLSSQELGPNGAKYALAKRDQEGSAGSFKLAGAFGLGGFNMPKIGDGATPGAASGGSSSTNLPQRALDMAAQNLGLRAATDPARLQRYMASGGQKYGVDPRYTPWCAAYVGASLEKAGIKASGALTARSYANWGAGVKTAEAQAGDVMMEGRDLHHVGFATGQKRTVNGRLQVEMLSGNYSHMVRKSWMPASEMTVRRATDKGTGGNPNVAKVAGARAMGGAVGRGLSYLVGERGPEIFTPGAHGQISTNSVLSKLADVGSAVTNGTGEAIAPSPERVAKARPDVAPNAGSSRSFHAGEHTHYWNITSDRPREIRHEVEGIFGDLMRQMECAQSGLLSD